MANKETVAAALSQVLSKHLEPGESTVEAVLPLVEVPKDKTHGDFAFPCFRLAKAFRKNPAAIAGELADEVTQALADFDSLEAVTAIGPYLNFKVSTGNLASSLIKNILNGSFFAPRPAKNEKVMIEYSQPNTHKAFHVGHTRNVALGDALIHMFEWEGYEVVAVNYIGDEGAHIAKCLWYFQNHFNGEVPDSNLGEFLGNLYTAAGTLLDFSLLSRCPIPDVVAAEILSVEPHPNNEKWTVVRVNDGQGEHTVACGGKGFTVGDKAAFARLGVRVAGRKVETIDKDGVVSSGMLCSGKELGLNEDTETIHLLPEGTAAGSQLADLYRVEGAAPEGQSIADIIKERNQGVSDTLKALESRQGETFELWKKTRQWSLDEFHRIYDWLGARFDHYFYESEVADRGKDLVYEYLEKGIFQKSQGAVGIDLSEDNLPFLLLLKSDGTGLYATKDLSLAQDKFEKFGIDHSIYVVDVSQSLHFQQVFKTLEKMGYEKAKNCYHLAYGLVVLPCGKMGSRFGNVILFSQLKERLYNNITSEYLERYRGRWSDAEINEAAKKISVATIRYGMLKTDNVNQITFDLDEWTSATGNTAPYMLYAYTRTRSVLGEMAKRNLEFDIEKADWNLLTHEKEQELMLEISKLPEVVNRAVEQHKPSLICHYLFKTAKTFSSFYDSCSAIHAGSEELMNARAALMLACGETLKVGLGLLGIETLERM